MMQQRMLTNGSLVTANVIASIIFSSAEETSEKTICNASHALPRTPLIPLICRRSPPCNKLPMSVDSLAVFDSSTSSSSLDSPLAAYHISRSSISAFLLRCGFNLSNLALASPYLHIRLGLLLFLYNTLDLIYEVFLNKGRQTALDFEQNNHVNILLTH